METPTLSSRAEKAIPQNAPQWAKRNPLTAIGSALTIVTSTLTILVFLGFGPNPPLEANEAYVTHEQFNILMTNLVKSVGSIEADIAVLKQDLDLAGEFVAAFGELEPVVKPLVIEENLLVPDDEVLVMEGKPSYKEAMGAIDRLKAAQEAVNTLQMEQRIQ